MDLLNAATVPRAEKVIKKANCLASDLAGDCVRITGPTVGGLYQVTHMDPTVDGTDQAVGVIISKTTSTLCYVQFHGPLHGVYAGLTPGKRLYVNADSQLTHTPPTPAGGGVLYLQVMGSAIDESVVLLTPETPVKRYG